MKEIQSIEEWEYQNAVVSYAKTDYLTFIKYTFPKFIINWHHRSISDILQQFADGNIKKLMLFCPPQVGKTQMSTRHLSAFLMGQNPDRKIAVCAYNASLARSFNRDIQRIIDDPLYANVFPETKLNTKNIATDAKGSALRNSEIFQPVGYQGYVKTVGLGGPLTSYTVDVGIIDDPIKDAQEAYSAVYRERAYDWYDKVFRTRLHNDSQQLMTLTRWHHDDLAGRILSQEDDWVVIKFPAIKEDDDNPYDKRTYGEALWPERHSLETMLKIKKQNPMTFASMYQQRPSVKEGNVILRKWFSIIDHSDLPFGKETIADFVIDSAEKDKKKNDPSAIGSFVVFNNILYITDYLEVRETISKQLKTYKSFVIKNGKMMHSNIYIEPKSTGGALVDLYKKHTRLRVLEWDMPKGGKMQRYKGIEYFVSQGRVVLVKGAWNQAFIQSCTEFPNGIHDEAVDILTMACTEGFLRNSYANDDSDDYGDVVSI